MPLMSWELWLARDIVDDNPLPWQKFIPKLTRGRVVQAFAVILAAIDTPARPPRTTRKISRLASRSVTAVKNSLSSRQKRLKSCQKTPKRVVLMP